MLQGAPRGGGGLMGEAEAMRRLQSTSVVGSEATAGRKPQDRDAPWWTKNEDAARRRQELLKRRVEERATGASRRRPQPALAKEKEVRGSSKGKDVRGAGERTVRTVRTQSVSPAPAGFGEMHGQERRKEKHAAFHCSVATDMYGKKMNVLLRLERTPSYEELVNYIESHFDVAGRANRPDGHPDVVFSVHTLKVYDTILSRWVELYSTAQLCRGCQLYAFQPESPWHCDLQGAIPKPRPVVAWHSSEQPARRNRAAPVRDSDEPPSKASKMRAVFGHLDTGSKGCILRADLHAYIEKLDINVPEGVQPSYLAKGQSETISLQEWAAFCTAHPNLLDALFFRSYPSWNCRTAALTVHEELLALRRYRERVLAKAQERRQLWQQRSALERQLDAQRKEADLGKLQAEIATTKEQAALDEIYFANFTSQAHEVLAPP